MSDRLTIYPFFRDEKIYTDTEPRWDYRELLKNMLSSIANYSSIKLKINTCTKTSFIDKYNFEVRRFNSCEMNLMHAIVASEADIVKNELGNNIIFCGSDEAFIKNPAELFEKYNFDILIGYDGLARIMNGLVCIRCNEKTEEFFQHRLECYQGLCSELKNWGGDMHSYNLALSQKSFLFWVLGRLSFPKRAVGKTNKLQSLIYMIARRIRMLDYIDGVGPLKVKFFYWGNEIAKSIDIDGGKLSDQVETAISEGFYLMDFKGERKQMLETIK